MPNGDYEQRGDESGRYVEGACAKCGRRVISPPELHRVLYATDGTPGGIFHERCTPTGPQWFGVGEEAPDL